MDDRPPSTPVTIHTRNELAQKIQEELGQNVYLCYQCIRCTSGCPVAEFFDWQPNQVMRALQLGQEDVALESQTPWLCACCQTCTTRCPQGLNITAIMEFLAREALNRGLRPKVSEVSVFNEAFMREIRLWGRAYELGLMAEVKLRNRDLFSDLDMGLKMFERNKLPFLPSPTRMPRKVTPVPSASKSIAYYPGCSLHSTAKEFNISTKAACEAIGLNLVEPRGWVCCGSTAAHRSDPEASLRLPLENLSLVEQSGFSEVTMPCAACFNRHKTALHEIRHDPKHKQVMDGEIGYEYRDTVKVTNLIEAILQHIGKDEITKNVQKPLKNLRLVCYYGCLLTRPPQVTGSKHPENPMEMDQIMSALGAEVLDWSYKTSCCGAAHSISRPDVARKLSSRLITQARAAGAEAVVVACPLCHTNLDARQFQMKLDEPTPVLYFTQLMALAFGMEKSAALYKNLTDPRPLLRDKGLLG